MPAANKSRPRTKPPEQRRDELVDAAQRLFLDQGVGPTTIEQITTGAGVAKGTFYLYFSSKEDLLAALGERYSRQLLAGIEAAIAGHAAADWKGKLASWARADAAGYLDSIRLHDIAFYGSRPAAREDFGSNIVVDHLFELLQAGVEAGAWAIDDARLAAVFLFNGIHGVVDDAYAREKRVSRSRLAQRLERLCFNIVGLASG